MGSEEKIDIDIIRVITRAIAESNNMVVMATHLTQLLVGALGIKGCTLFILNPKLKEFETLASFGLSAHYLNKGPILSDKSMFSELKGEPVIIRNVSNTDKLQYPDDAKQEGIGSIASIPIMLYEETIGALRLYHYEPWDVSEKDLDSLMLVGEIIGIAMTYTRILSVLQQVKGTIDDVHPIWIKAGRV